MVMNRNKVLELLESKKDEFRKYGVSRVGLFGSFAREEQGLNSDVDLLVEFEPGRKNYRNFIGFFDLAERLFDRKVEVSTPQSVSAFIAPYIEKDVKYVQVN